MKAGVEKRELESSKSPQGSSADQLVHFRANEDLKIENREPNGYSLTDSPSKHLLYASQVPDTVLGPGDRVRYNNAALKERTVQSERQASMRSPDEG